MDIEFLKIEESIMDYLFSFKENFIKSKKYWIMFLILICILSLSLFKLENYNNPNMEIIIIAIVSIMGVFSITTYFQYNDKELYKTVFIIILIFGLVCCLITPMVSIPDEGEHAYRAEITSRGVLFPEPINGTFESIKSMTLFAESKDLTVFQEGWDTNKIDYNVAHTPSVFQQNPFFGYIFSGFGILLAKLLDLNVIWMLWLGRIFNAILYAGLISYAVKKTPILKMPIFAIACFPLCLYQAYSLSVDGLVIGFGILIISYFFNMCENKFSEKELITFIILCLLIGFCKVPYFGLLLLLFFIPNENFEDDKNTFYLYCLIGILLVAIVGFAWNKFIASPALINSWRGEYLISNNVNAMNQINFILSHPFEFFINIFNTIPNSINDIFDSMFKLYSLHHGGFSIKSPFANMLLLMFFGFICLGYPIEKKFKLKSKIGALITFIIVYTGTYIVFLLSWNPVGELTYKGVQARYFLPLFALLPMICNINLTQIKGDSVDYHAIVLIVFFIAAMIISLTTLSY